jgi:hypothetical protein
MRKTVSFEIGEAAATRSALRRRVIYFPDAEMNQQFEQTANDEGFQNVSAFAVWLFKRFLRQRGAKSEEQKQ